MRGRTLTALLASQLAGCASALCAANQHVQGKKCVPCPINLGSTAGDDPAGADTYCNPRNGVYLSIDNLLRAPTACVPEVRKCFGSASCTTGAISAIHVMSFTFAKKVDLDLYNLVLCSAALEPPPPVAPPPPPNGGNNTGPVHVTFGAVFPLSGVGCEEGWHALFGAMKARDVINCESSGGIPPVHLTDADAKKVGVKYMGSSCSHNLNLKMLVRDDKKLATNALYGVDQMLHQGVDALVGPMDSHVAKLVALFAQYEQVPVVSYRAAMAKLTNESMTTLTNFMRVYPSEEIIAKGIIDFIAEYKWEGVTFISTDDEYGYDAVRIFDKHMSTLKANMEKKGEQSLEYYETFTMDPTNAKSIEDKLNEIKETGWRIVVLMVAEENAVPILHQAARLRMLRLGWVWLGNEWATDEVYENYNVVASGKPDGGSTDGTGAYLAEELDGLVTFRVQEANTQPSIELEQAWNREKATYGNTTMCPGLSSQQKHLHKLGDFAFDAVMVAASGCEKAAGLRAADPTRMGHWWRNGRKSVSFGVSGRSMMYKQMNSAKLQSAATGAVGFTPQGDPDMAKIEISNWVGGKFKNVGSWVQAEADYAKCVQAAATGKQCGVLQIRQDDVTWMGGMQGGSPPDRANHLNHVHAEYMTLVAWLLIVSIVGGNLLELIHFHYMPEAGFTIIVGLLAGLIVKAYGYVTSSYHMEELARFDEKVFSLLLLPIIIFDAGFGAKKARFFMNLGPILITALIGTSISTLIVGFSLYFLEDVTNVHMGIPEALTFGAVISAVDPVATLAVFGALKVEHNLYYRVFGESLINDACAIVLFRVFQKFIVAEVTTISVLKGVWSFIVIFFGSIAAGVIIGMLASLTIKMAHIHDPLLAAGMFIICSYISYEASEAAHLSGIIASLFCGFTMRHYGLNNIAQQFHSYVLDLVHMLACMADLMIFFSVGLNVILFAPYDKKTFIVISMCLCLVGRVANVFPLCGLWNLCSSNKIPFKDQVVMVHAGLRGAIAFNLALFFPTQNQKYVIDATTWVILVTVFVFGGTTVTLLNVLGIETGCEPDSKDMKWIDAKKIRDDYYQEGWATEFNCKLKAVLSEYQLRRCLVRPPEEEMGVFSLPWEELTESQQQAARDLGYSNVGDIRWPESPHNNFEQLWENLHPDDKAAATTLGLEMRTWPPPDFSALAASDMKVKSHESGHDTGFEDNSEFATPTYMKTSPTAGGIAASSTTTRQHNPMQDDVDDDEPTE